MVIKSKVFYMTLISLLVITTLSWGMEKDSPPAPPAEPAENEKEEILLKKTPAGEEDLTLPEGEEVKPKVLVSAEATTVEGRDIQITTGQIEPISKKKEEE